MIQEKPIEVNVFDKKEIFLSAMNELLNDIDTSL